MWIFLRSELEALSWLRVFKSGDAMRVGHGGRQAQQTKAILPEKRGGRRGSMWDGRRVIAGCFTRMLRRCAGRTNVRFLHILQEIRVIGKTRNQLSTTTRLHSRWIASAMRRLRCERYAAWFLCWC